MTKRVTPKRGRSDSATAAVTAEAAAAQGPIEPPDYVRLREGDRPFWDAVVRARARETWTDSDLCNAGNLARSLADIERLQGEIDREGDIVLNAKDTPIVNPRHALLETLSRRVMALSRMLHVHAEATVGNSRDARQGAVNEKRARGRQKAAASAGDRSALALIPTAAALAH
jgi:hypothetical protein